MKMKKLVDKSQIENQNSEKEMEKEMSKMLSIKEVCNEFGLSEVYVRRMILKGKLQSEKVLIAANTYKHMIAIEEVERWRKASQGRGSRRGDGRNKFTLYATPEEIAQIQKLVGEAKIESQIVRSNAKKVNMSDAK